MSAAEIRRLLERDRGRRASATAALVALATFVTAARLAASPAVAQTHQELSSAALPSTWDYIATKTADIVVDPNRGAQTAVGAEFQASLTIDEACQDGECTYSTRIDSSPFTVVDEVPAVAWAHDATTWTLAGTAPVLSSQTPTATCVLELIQNWRFNVTDAAFDGTRWVATRFEGTLEQGSRLDPTRSSGTCLAWEDIQEFSVVGTAEVTVIPISSTTEADDPSDTPVADDPGDTPVADDPRDTGNPLWPIVAIVVLVLIGVTVTRRRRRREPIDVPPTRIVLEDDEHPSLVCDWAVIYEEDGVPIFLREPQPGGKLCCRYTIRLTTAVSSKSTDDSGETSYELVPPLDPHQIRVVNRFGFGPLNGQGQALLRTEGLGAVGNSIARVTSPAPHNTRARGSMLPVDADPGADPPLLNAADAPELIATVSFADHTILEISRITPCQPRHEIELTGEAHAVRSIDHSCDGHYDACGSTLDSMVGVRAWAAGDLSYSAEPEESDLTATSTAGQVSFEVEFDADLKLEADAEVGGLNLGSVSLDPSLEAIPATGHSLDRREVLRSMPDANANTSAASVRVILHRTMSASASVIARGTGPQAQAFAVAQHHVRGSGGPALGAQGPTTHPSNVCDNEAGCGVGEHGCRCEPSFTFTLGGPPSDGPPAAGEAAYPNLHTEGVITVDGETFSLAYPPISSGSVASWRFGGS